MRVSVITPTTHSREHFNERIREIFESQDYPNKEHLFDYSNDSIGAKRNNLCNIAKGEIILHFDSDDIYAPNWISKSVEFLLASKGNCTGLSKAFFKNNKQWYLYKAQENAQPYVCGATMCYYKELWQRNPFENINRGEDLRFQTNAMVRPHNYIDGFTANIHGDNIGSYSKILTSKEFTRLAPTV